MPARHDGERRGPPCSMPRQLQVLPLQNRSTFGTRLSMWASRFSAVPLHHGAGRGDGAYLRGARRGTETRTRPRAIASQSDLGRKQIPGICPQNSPCPSIGRGHTDWRQWRGRGEAAARPVCCSSGLAPSLRVGIVKQGGQAAYLCLLVALARRRVRAREADSMTGVAEP